MIPAAGSGGDVAEPVALKKHDIFYGKNVAIKSPYEFSRH
jgi:hypothetical protein